MVRNINFLTAVVAFAARAFLGAVLGTLLRAVPSTAILVVEFYTALLAYMVWHTHIVLRSCRTFKYHMDFFFAFFFAAIPFTKPTSSNVFNFTSTFLVFFKCWAVHLHPSEKDGAIRRPLVFLALSQVSM